MAHDIGSQMMVAEWLFVETLKDLRARCVLQPEPERYQLLGIAPLLRKLMLESNTLIQTVNGPRRLKLQFRIHPYQRPPETPREDGGRMVPVLGFGRADLIGSDEDEPVNLERFLSTPVGFAREATITVKDIVTYYANAEGGVHFGKPRNPTVATDMLQDVTPILFGFRDPSIVVLARIGTIVARGLEELEAAILKNPTDNALRQLVDENGVFRSHWAGRSKPLVAANPIE